ncbi:MAG: rhodanese-like domain-containing protein [Desulfobacteraceae bacterium]|nr:rhodanese-like domain-containing protein [Desulfobacteraceae bacterium]
MALNSNPMGITDRFKFNEICIIIGISCCIGMVFNLFWINRVPFITPPKAEMYAKRDIPTISLEETREKLDRHGIIFLDARGVADYELKHIKGALNLPVSYFDLYYPKMKKFLPMDAEIVVYCEGEECGASLHLAEELIAMQYKNVLVFLGGWVEWNKAGYPAE